LRELEVILLPFPSRSLNLLMVKITQAERKKGDVKNISFLF